MRGAAASGCNEATVVVGATARCLSAAAGCCCYGQARVASTCKGGWMDDKTREQASPPEGETLVKGLLLLIFGCDGGKGPFFCGLWHSLVFLAAPLT